MTRIEPLYIHVQPDVKKWLERTSEESGLSMAKVAATLLAHCREQDLTITIRSGIIVGVRNEPQSR